MTQTGLVRPAQQASPVMADIISRPRLQRLLVCVVIATAAVLYVVQADVFQIGTYVDDGHYLVTARGLASGAGFSLINFPDNPAETRFPPGYPLLLTPVAIFAGDNLAPFRLPALLCTMASLPLWFLLLRRWLSFTSALGLLAVTATSPAIVQHSTMVMSEAPFLLLFLLLIVTVEAWTAAERLTPWQYAALAALLLALYFVRTVGIVLCGALLVYLLLRRRLRSAAVLTALVLPTLVGWAYRNHLTAGGVMSAGYERAFTQPVSGGVAQSGLLLTEIGNMVENLQYYGKVGLAQALALYLGNNASGQSVDRVLHAIGADWLPDAVGLTICGALILGLVVRGRRLGFPELAAFLFLVALVVWPGQADRLVYPLVPLLYLNLFQGVATVCGWIPVGSRAWLRRSGLPLAALGLLLWNVAVDVQAIRNPVRSRVADLATGADWIARNAPQESVIMTPDPVPRYLYMHRKTVDVPDMESTDADRLRLVERAQVAYVLIAPRIRIEPRPELEPRVRQVLRWIGERPEHFQLVYSNTEQNVQVYRVLPGG